MSARFRSITCGLLLLGAVFALVGTCSGQLMPGGWPKFRADAVNSGLGGDSGPATAALGWTYTTGGTISSSAAVAPNGAIYAASQDGYLYSLNPDGTLGWRYYTSSSSQSSPAISEAGVVYVGSDNSYLYAVNPNGTLQWRVYLGAAIGSSPNIGPDGTIYCGTSKNKLYAVNPDSSIKWSYSAGSAITASPAIGPDGTIYVAVEDGYLYALWSTGSLRWRYRTSQPILSSPAVAADGTIYFGGNDRLLHAVNPNGTLKWGYFVGQAAISSPAIGPDGTVYIGSNDRYVYAVDSNGQLRWRYQTGSNVQSSPAVGADGSVYVASFDGYVYALSSAGSLLWRYQIGSYVSSSPSIGPDGTLYVGSDDRKLYAFSRDQTPPSTPVVTDDGQYTTSATTLHASWTSSDPDTGIAEYRYAIGTSPGGTNVVDWTSVATDTQVTRTDLSLSNGATYYVSVKARNGSHLWSDVGSTDGITVDTTPPQAPTVADDGLYTASADTLHASWTAQDLQSGIAGYEYAIGTSPGAADVAPWTSAGSAMQVTRTGLSLSNGSTYFFSVRARNGAGLWSEPGSSDGIRVDTTPPDVPEVTDDGQYTPSLNSLHAMWSAHDPESGVAEYEYAVGTHAGATDVRGWTSAGTNTQATVQGLSLTDGGTYYFSVRAKNGAGGWSAPGSSDGITVDATAPSIPLVTDDGGYTASPDMLHAVWSSDDPQSGIAEYHYAIGTSPGGTNVVNWTSAGTATQVTRTGLSLTNGVTYYFSVKARNRAGSWSSPGSSDGIVIDATTPSIPVVIDDGQYTSSNTSLHAVWSSQDAESGVAEYEYAIGTSAGTGDVVGWTSVGAATQVTRMGLSLSDGVTYYVSVRARNGAGLWSVAGSSDGITVDTTPPPAPVVTDDGQFTSSATSLHASWTCDDAQSGVVEYQYAIGTFPGASDVTAWASTGSASEVTRSGLVLSSGVTYYFSVKARNRVGMWSAVGSSDGIRVDTSIPTLPSVTDDGDYTSDSTSLHAAWSASDPESAITEYQYAIGTSPGYSNVVGWTSAGAATQVTATGLSLTTGATYYFAVKARNGAGLWSGTGVSNGITVDTTPPAAPVVVDDGQYSTSLTTLHAAWSAQDSTSGVAEYQYAIGTSPGLADVVGWTSAGTAMEVTRTDLALTNGATYYFAVKARNRAGLWSAVGSSDGIMADSTAPDTPAITDDGEFTSVTNSLHASWSSADAESGVAEYQYAIGTSPGAVNVVNWTSTGASTQILRTGLALANGATYYFAVKAKNRAGLWSVVGTSDGIRVDTTAPGAPAVTDDGDYTASLTSLHASWTSSDAESGIAEYSYAIGTTPGGADLVAWTSAATQTEVTADGLNLADGATYYFSVKARNRAGLWSAVGVSNGITVDSIPPSTPVVTDDGEFTSSADTLHASWTSVDGGSGIAEYQFAIGTTPGGADTAAWASAGTNLQVTRTGLSLANGVTYYFAVKARNCAGKWSDVGVSDGIRVDLTPPTKPVVTDDGAYTSVKTSLHATWAAADPESGIIEYQYAVGTSPGSANLVGWTSAGAATEVTRSGLSLAEGAAYYISVRARNRAGLWSDVGSSDGITVDTTGPSTPVVIDDGEFTASFDGLHATWNASDAQSGIAEYEYAIGTTAGATDVRGWTSVGPSTEVTAQGLLLQEGRAYYFAVRARNGAGMWSGVGVSDGIRVIGETAWPMFRADAKHRACSGAPACTTGGMLWEFATSGWVESSVSIAGNGTVYFGSGDGGMYAVSRNGGMLWRYETAGPIDSSPAIGKDGKIVFGSYDGYIYCLYPNGQPCWRYPTGDQIWSSPVIGPDDTVYIGSQDGYLYAINWSGTLKWRLNIGHTVWSSPALDNNGVIYFGAGDGYVYAVYSSTGTVKWRYQTGTAVDSSPSIADDGTVYMGSGDGYFYAIRADGTLRWKFWSGWPFDSSAAIARDGTIYVGIGHDFSYGYLYALDPDGRVKWQYDVDGEVRSSPSIGGDGTIYVGSGDGHIYAITPQGQLRWRYQTGAAIFASPSIATDGTVYIGSFDGNLYAFKDTDLNDSTPPAPPVVTDEGAATTSGTALSASWTATDPESGVTGYMYAIGTTPGASDVVPWTSVNGSTSVTRNGLPLTSGATYYFAVKARNGAGLWSSAGVSDGIVAVRSDQVMKIGLARKAADGALVCLKDKVVTGVFSDCFYIEESDRSAAIRVVLAGGAGPQNGRLLTLTGILQTVAGERVISLKSMAVGAAGSAPASMGMSHRVMGWGEPMESAPTVPTGMNNVGLLVSTWGRVTSVGAGFFYIDDGCAVTDASGATGVKVTTLGTQPAGAVPMPSVGDCVRVTGVISCESCPGGIRRLLRPRFALDLVIMQH